MFILISFMISVFYAEAGPTDSSFLVRKLLNPNTCHTQSVLRSGENGSLKYALPRPACEALLLSPKTLFRESDEIALKIMVDKQTLTLEEASFYSKASDNVPNLSCITIIDAYNFPIRSIGEFPLDSQIIPKASMRMTSGQINEVAYPLPWMQEFPELAKTVDRNHYQWIWEIGRTVALESGYMEDNLALLAYEAKKEVEKSGGDINKAFFFAHTTNQRNKILFKRFYGAKEFSTMDQHTILVRPLTELLKKFRIEERFPEIDEIARKSNIGHAQAARLFEEARETRLDVIIPPTYLSEISVYDLSQFSALKLKVISEKTNLTFKEVDVLSRKPTDTLKFLENLDQTNSVFISNFRMRKGKKNINSEQILDVMKSVKKMYVEKFQKLGFSENDARALVDNTNFYTIEKPLALEPYLEAGFSVVQSKESLHYFNHHNPRMLIKIEGANLY